jgi:NAD(P)-dependent dehydrogenase (short-subunit alcohol dehydrogenase family)
MEATTDVEGDGRRGLDDLSGMVSIITGAASLIGVATIERLVARGASVLATDVPANADRIDGLGRSSVVRFEGGDLADEAHLRHIVAVAERTFGGVDHLVNVAARFDDPKLAATQDDWRMSFDVNVIAAARLISLARESMVARGGGAVVNVASISGLRAQPDRLVYPVTKAALLGLTRNCAMLLAAEGIRVNAVVPGWTWSRNIARRYGSRERADQFAAEFQALGRLASPDEIAEAILFLLSRRSSFTTGAELSVDGGYSAMGPEALGQAFLKVPVIERAPVIGD